LIKEFIIQKEVNNTEVGVGNTNDSYILVTEGIDITDIFEKVYEYEDFKSLVNNKLYKIRYSGGRETRIIGLGNFYRDHNVSAGDLVIIGKRIIKNEKFLYIDVKKKENSIFLKKFKNGYELLTCKKISLINSETKIIVGNTERKFELKKIGAENKRADSPNKTDIYQIFDSENNSNIDLKFQNLEICINNNFALLKNWGKIQKIVIEN